MSDDRGQHPARGSAASRGGRVSGSSVLTPPTGVPVVPSVLPVSHTIPAQATTPAAITASCLCGHDPDAHRHWRRGSDCGQCGVGACTVYRPSGGPIRRLLWSLSRPW